MQPQFRERRARVIVNVSSSVTLRPLHLLSAYSASKAAVNAFTESLALKLEPFGIRVGLVLPGSALSTNFATSGRALIATEGGFPAAYADQVEATMAKLTAAYGPKTQSADVADAVFRVVTDADAPMRLPAGADAVEWSNPGRGQKRLGLFAKDVPAGREARVDSGRTLASPEGGLAQFFD